jgi:hypothetical protein
LKRAGSVTIPGDYRTMEPWMRDWYEFCPNLEVIYLKYPSVMWSRPIKERGRLRPDNVIEEIARAIVKMGERYIENFGREKISKGLEWKPPRVEAVWPEGVERGPKYIYPSQYK